MNGELIIQKLSERIGQLETENIILKLQLEELTSELEKLKSNTRGESE